MNMVYRETRLVATQISADLEHVNLTEQFASGQN